MSDDPLIEKLHQNALTQFHKNAWNPVYEKLLAEKLIKPGETIYAALTRLQAEIDRKSSMPGDHRYWEGRYRDEAAENEKLRAELATTKKDALEEAAWRLDCNCNERCLASHEGYCPKQNVAAIRELGEKP